MKLIEARKRVNFPENEVGVVSFEIPKEELAAPRIDPGQTTAIPGGSVDQALLYELILALEGTLEGGGVKIPAKDKAAIIASSYGDIVEHFTDREQRNKALIFTRSMFRKFLLDKKSKE